MFASSGLQHEMWDMKLDIGFGESGFAYKANRVICVF